jgi:uncharacterized damage-inducible protein DinB
MDSFITRAKHYLTQEYRIKLRKAVEALPNDRLWWRPNDASNSVGNLLRHLAGNVHQWIVGGVGGRPDSRDRAAEFAARDGASKAELLAALDAVLDEAGDVLDGLSSAALAEPREIQGRHITVLDALFHVVEHFSLHLGQVIYISKLHAPGAIQFYEDAGGLARPKW